MEQVLEVLMENAMPAVLSAVVALVAWAGIRIEKLVRRTDTELDDELFEAFLDGVADGAKRADTAVSDAGTREARKDEG